MADHAHNLRAEGGRFRPFGVITRGTTGVNRLRRCDRWMTHHPDISSLLRAHPAPLALDVGYGASHTTTVEWARWMRRVNPSVEVIGLEIDPERVLAPRDGVRFELGGFELAGHSPHLVRAFNVLRQYDVDQVPAAWESVTSRLKPGGMFVEGTCDEIGRRSCWLLIDASGPRTLTMAWDAFDIEQPSDVAERLPKVLIHRNRPGEKIYELLLAADEAYRRAAAFAPYGPRVRWEKAHDSLRAAGVPIYPRSRRRTRDCFLTIDWEHVKP
ncbi:class I SAM-dependent methyltransferase [Corynebacterium tapiri]|uniref:Class I SAM-dependent methyltransferase n=1 Tax=Corynebacterium tapiri TaxID=1448266 RepID=A0A5C4U417_9CORY|nr:class I SAM-dependent methyltransferase [Corynebacterium tapiri]TNL97320.1 class I SAM-dependent methyltransferase [Corynebacterium tapiri]